MGVKKTFWSIISNQSIEIPTIQRDYAQGRDIPRITKIRDRFVKDLIKSLKNNKLMHLDFVYGKEEGKKSQMLIRRNKKSIEDLLGSIKSYAGSLDLVFEYDKIMDKNEHDSSNLHKLLPLDGQQRLTTLFILHWYLAKRLEKADVLQILRKFSYKTRKSSASFIESICDEKSKPDFNNKSLEDELILQSNFSFTWKKDPTVRGILSTANFIHNECRGYKKEEIELLLERLLNTDLINFDYLNLQEFDLSDDLYVKMNARGKFLTDFENFKAWLYSVIESDPSNLGIYDWEIENNKFDLQWTDIFWNAKTKGSFKIDNAFLQYFKLMYTADYLKSMTVFNSKLTDTVVGNDLFTDSGLDQITKTITDKNENLVFDFEKYFDTELFRKKIPNYFKLLDFIDENGWKTINDITAREVKIFYKNVDTFSSLFLSENSLNFSWSSFIDRYLIFRYIEKKEKKVSFYTEKEIEEFKKFVRVLFNLVHNKIIANKHLYFQALDAIDQIIDQIDFENVEGWFVENEIPFFDTSQTEEERIKLVLINSDIDWKHRILESEEHPYFKGQINFLLQYAGIYDIYRNQQTNFSDQENLTRQQLVANFDLYYYRFNKLFGENGLRPEIDNNLFKSALLTFGFYFINVGHQKYHTLRNIDRDYSWKRLLSESVNENEYSKKSKIIRMLVDNIEDYDNLNASLSKITKEKKTLDTHLDFLTYFPQMFSKCNNNLARFHQNIENNGYSYLVHSVNVNYPKDKEIHLYGMVLYLRGKECVVKHSYDEQKDNHFITSVNGKAINISFVYDSNNDEEKSYYIVETESQSQEFSDFENCVNYILNYLN